MKALTLLAIAILAPTSCLCVPPPASPPQPIGEIQTFEPAKTYTFLNKASGHLLTAGYGGTIPKETRVWHWPSSGDPWSGKGVEWLVMPAEGHYFWIINRISGFGLHAGREEEIEFYLPYYERYKDNQDLNKLHHERSVSLYSLRQKDHQADRFLWRIEKTDAGGYKITNKSSGSYLCSGGDGPKDLRVWHKPKEEAKGFLWDIKGAGDLPFDLTTQPGTTPNDIGDVDRITDIGYLPKEQTDRVVIGEVLMPFFLVKDPWFPSIQEQVKNNPYYKFKREGYWRRVFYYQHDGKQEITKTTRVKTGLVTTSARTMEETTGFKVTARASFSYSGWGAKLSASIEAQFSKELKVTTSRTDTKLEEKEETIEVKLPATGEFAIAKWMRADRYTLSRLSGEEIVVFDVIDPNETVSDGYPD